MSRWFVPEIPTRVPNIPKGVPNIPITGTFAWAPGDKSWPSQLLVSGCDRSGPWLSGYWERSGPAVSQASGLAAMMVAGEAVIASLIILWPPTFIVGEPYVVIGLDGINVKARKIPSHQGDSLIG